MAWAEYATNLKKSGAEIGGVYGLDGNKWAEIEGTNSTQAEIFAIINAMKAGSFASEMLIGSHTYRVLEITDQEIKAKCKAPEVANKCLVHVARANTCVVIGGMSGAGERNITKIVDDMSRYLKNNNY